MIQNLSHRIVSTFSESSIIDADDAELYAYGLEIVIGYALVILSSVMLAALLGLAVEVILFVVCYLPMRIYAGGYHARTYGRCYLLSCTTIIAAAILAKYILPGTGQHVLLIIMIGAGLVTGVLGAVEDANKPLTEAQKKDYSRKVKIVLVAEYIAAILATTAGLDTITRVMCISWVVMAGMGLLGRKMMKML